MKPRLQVVQQDSQDPLKPRRDDAGRYQGGFHPDGVWNPNGDWCSPLDWFVRRLVTARRTAKHSPAWFAAVIRATEQDEEGFGRFAKAFTGNCLDAWDLLDDWEQWSQAPAPTAAAEHLKRCGLGTLVAGAWAGGWWVPEGHPRIAEWEAFCAAQPKRKLTDSVTATLEKLGLVAK